ncbi:MAG: phospholipase [Desulfovibrio sp. MES5]|uniref:DISARM system phospholipase D-like protein DrmC n=1 Tax=Desulfovibrio sp. MES5 TaxID=1899016 RepID=UPI000B9CB062|nr:DISARM system phospholipase D-like protein DrmC [Desulfovibrio sp. MES5]OXS27907.1 MAG: phospholipase [Desulfovibrio sp. MES5]
MDDLLAVIAELGLELHPDRIAVIANKINTLGSVEQFALLKSSFGPNADKDLIGRFDQAWNNSKGTAPCDVAAALRGASATATLRESRGAVEMVWTGPSTGQIPVRHTEQVLCEVINYAKRRLFLVSFVAYDVASIIAALKNAIGRQVHINILLEASSMHGGRVSNHDSISAMKKALPSVCIYTWISGKKGTGSYGISGAVHAKCAVADEELAFITSANLTAAAMERNMELGVLVKGGNLPIELHQHLEALISTKIIEQV